MILNDNSVTLQDIKIKFFKFNLTPMGDHFRFKNSFALFTLGIV